MRPSASDPVIGMSDGVYHYVCGMLKYGVSVTQKPTNAGYVCGECGHRYGMLDNSNMKRCPQCKVASQPKLVK
jgi:rubrerythrin